MTLVAFETSCDETGVAVIRDGVALSNLVSSQVSLHEEYGGVVPELAAREHLKNLAPLAREAMSRAGVVPGEVQAVAATCGPGLAIALLVGLKAAQGMAFGLGKPFLGINHHEAHLYSPWITGSPARADYDEFEPNVSLIVSGGHTLLVLVESEAEHRVLGGTIDDAAGECFDKTGKLMGLPYPAGPIIDQLAREGNREAFSFPRPLIHDGSEDFSFSGLKTSVRYFLRDNPGVLEKSGGLRDLCASIQAAIVEVLASKTVRAARRLGVKCVTASGGVTCNMGLREMLKNTCAKHGLKLRLAPRELCTDNAAMIGLLAERRLMSGAEASALDAEPDPGLSLA